MRRRDPFPRRGPGALAFPGLAHLWVAFLWVGRMALAGEGPLPPPPAPDPGFYAQRLAPWIEEHCAACHRRGGGALRLAAVEKSAEGAAEGAAVAARRRADFEALAAFVRPGAPEESRLLRKVLDPAEGGDPHVGGAFVRAGTPEHDRLLDFVSGATLANVTPEVWFEHTEIAAKPGETVVIDGRDSYDRDLEDMERLAWWWDLHARPAGSRVLVRDRRASRLEFEPDTGGTYVFRLRVGDGKVWSAPRAVTVEVFDRARIERTPPGGISDLDQVAAGDLARVRRLYLDVLGRPPTPSEAIAEARRGPDALARDILGRAEAGQAWVEDVAARLGLYGDFRPEGDAARDLALRVPAESLPPQVVERTLALDPAFLRRHPPGRAFAQAVATLLLDRGPTEAEVQAGLDLAAGRPADLPEGGRAEDARAWLAAVLGSEAFARAAIARRLHRFLDSGDATRRLGHAVAAAREGGAAWRSFLDGVLRDRRYVERTGLRPKGTLTLLRSLFIDLVEREPTDRELASLLHAVETMPGQGAAYAAVARVLIDSGQTPLPLLVDIQDGPRWLRDRFLRYLGRRPTAKEVEAYGKALLHARGGPELVVFALLTGPEYACR